MIVLNRFGPRPPRTVVRLFPAALILAVFGISTSQSAEPPAAKAETAPVRSAELPSRERLRPGDPHAHGLTDADLNAIRAIMRNSVDDRLVPGASLLLAHKGEVIFKEAFGNLTLDSKAQMASSSKPVTSTLLMILVDQDKLALDDPLEKYLPEFKGIQLHGKPPAKLPTVRNVISNMSGLPGDFLTESLMKRLRKGVGKADEPDVAKGKNANDPRTQFFSGKNRTLADSVRTLAAGGLATEPGAEFHYCTMGFNVAARVAEVVAGKPFEKVIQTELFDPLGMTHTQFVSFGLPKLTGSTSLPAGENRFIMAGGGMTSTLDDFAAFYQMHLNRGTYLGRRILSERSADEMRTRQGKLDLLMSGPYGNDYGLAFFLNGMDPNGRARVITHPGLFGTTPWLDRDRELVGVLFVQSNFLRIIPFVRELQTQVREIVPVGDLMGAHLR